MVDLKLTLTSDGYYDLSISNGKFDTVNGFETALLMSFFSEKRAAPSEVPIPQNQRGWWGNLFSPYSGYEMGSKVWLLSQARITQDTLNLGLKYVEEGYQWLLDDGYAEKVIVTGDITSERIRFYITVYRINSEVLNISYDLWQQTRVN